MIQETCCSLIGFQLSQKLTRRLVYVFMQALKRTEVPLFSGERDDRCLFSIYNIFSWAEKRVVHFNGFSDVTLIEI